MRISEFAPPSLEAFTNKIAEIDTLFANAGKDSDNSVSDYAVLISYQLGAPWPLSDELVSWFKSLSSDAAASFIDEFIDTAWSPIRIANLRHLVSQRDDCRDKLEILARRFISSGLKAAPIIKNFASAALSMMLARGDGQYDYRSLLMAAWIWADQLFIALAGNRIDLEALAQWCAEIANVQRRGLIDLLRLSSIENPLKIYEARLVAASLWRCGSEGLERFSSEERKQLANALSLKGDGKAPHTSLFAGGKPAALAGSWLTESPKQLLALFDDQNPFLDTALEAPDSLIDELLNTPMTDFSAFILVGLDRLSALQVERLFSKLRREISFSDRHQLLIICSIVSLTPAKGKVTLEQKNRLFVEIAKRHTDLDRQFGRDPDSLFFVLEHAIAMACREAPSWVANVEAIYRRLAQVFVSEYASELTKFLRPLIESARFSDRVPLQVLKSEIDAFIQPK